VRARRIHEALDRDEIVLVTGFQGVSADWFDATTLGRIGQLSNFLRPVDAVQQRHQDSAAHGPLAIRLRARAYADTV
jgi:hypothetical protein